MAKDEETPKAEDFDLEAVEPEDINLDTDRAARLEMRGKPQNIVFKGQEFPLPVELPLRAVTSMADLQKAMRAKDGDGITRSLLIILKSLVGDEYETFMDLGPTAGDLGAIVRGIPKAYGLSAPESVASVSSSKSTSAQPRRRSKPTTK